MDATGGKIGRGAPCETAVLAIEPRHRIFV